MRYDARFAATTLAIVMLFTSAVDARQTGQRTPRLTTEDVRLPSPLAKAPNVGIHPPSVGVNSWARHSPGYSGLSLELPGAPMRYNMPLPEKSQGVILDPEAYVYNDDMLAVFVVHFSFMDCEAMPVCLKSFAAGFMEGLTKNAGRSEVAKSVKVANPSTLSLKGSYYQNGANVELEGVVKSRGSQVWLVAAMFPKEAPLARTSARRVMASFKIK